jgi:hypothetical protein
VSVIPIYVAGGCIVLLSLSSLGLVLIAFAAGSCGFFTPEPDVFANVTSVMRAPILESLDGGSISNTELLESKKCMVRLKGSEPGEKYGQLALTEMDQGPDGYTYQ